jgi:hypothetical protein
MVVKHLNNTRGGAGNATHLRIFRILSVPLPPPQPRACPSASSKADGAGSDSFVGQRTRPIHGKTRYYGIMEPIA